MRRSAPLITRRLANLCLRQCHVKPLDLGALTAASNHARGVRAPPLTNSMWLRCRRNSASARSAVVFNGTWLVFPPLSKRIVTRRRSKSTSAQRAPYCFPCRSPLCNAGSSSGSCSGHFSRIALRRFPSSSRDRKRTRQLFSVLCCTSRAGLKQGCAKTFILTGRTSAVGCNSPKLGNFYL